VSLADSAYEQLLAAIVTGRMAPGERIRDQQLAAGMGVSRVPVREALRRLTEQGLVETQPSSATRVAPVRAERAAQAFVVIAALQALAARLGVPALTRVDDELMFDADDRRTVALRRGDVLEGIAADDAFHGVVLDASGNVELKRALARLMPQIRRLDLLHFAGLSRSDPAQDHVEILKACRRRDARAAAELIEANFLRLGAQITALLAAGEECHDA